MRRAGHMVIRMALTDLPVLSSLKTKMMWLQARQRVLAENVANADTPDYTAKDLKPLSFDQMVKAETAGTVELARTSKAHIAGAPLSDNGSGFGTDNKTSWETTPSGNGVVLEEQMMKVTSNQMEYQTAASLYSKSIALLRIAVGSQ